MLPCKFIPYWVKLIDWFLRRRNFWLSDGITDFTATSKVAQLMDQLMSEVYLLMEIYIIDHCKWKLLLKEWKIGSMKQMQKWNDQHVLAGQRKNLCSQPDSNLWPPLPSLWVLYPLELRRTLGERSHILGSYFTHITARISNVDDATCGERMKDGKF